MSQLPKNWKLKTFGDVLSLVTNGINGKQNKAALGIPVSRIETIANQSIDMSRVGYLESYDNDKIDKYLLNANDILFSHINSALHLGKTALVPKGLTLYHGINLLRLSVNELVEPRYFNYYCKYFRLLGEFSANAQHSVNQSSLNQKKLKSFNIPIAPKDEQNLIAGKLDSVLAKVEAAQARLDKIPTILKRFRQSVLAAATSGELTKDWRENHCELTNKVANVFITEYDGKELDELPIEWGYVSFKDAAEIKSNLVDPKETPDAIHLAPNHIEANSGRILELVTVEKDGVKSNKHRFFSGQIVYSKIRPYLNKVCAVDFEGLCSADMYPIESKLNREYLLYVMLSEQFVHFTSQQQGRVVLPKINQKALNKIPVPVPPDAEQKEIARVVSELLAKTEVIEKQYKAAKLRVDKMTQSILARAFSGKLFSPLSEDDRETVVVKTQSTQPEHTKSDNAKVTQVDEKETSEKTDFAPESKVVSSAVTENHSEQTGEVFKLLRSNNKGMSAQALFDALSDNTFSAIDVLFSELKKLIKQKVVIQAGEGENSTFKVTKK